jgi:hypothetical protein
MKMKIYRIVFNECSYDNYRGFVIVASSENDVVKLIRVTHPGDDDGWEDFTVDWKSGYKIEEIDPKTYIKPEIILSDFMAG